MGKGLFENTKGSLDSKKIELYTPKFAVDMIIPYIATDKVIWAPFDLESSNFVRYLRSQGYKVIYSHILAGQDFMDYEPKEHWDIILSNPPFKGKGKWVERASSFGKPFAFILPLMWMNDISWNQYHEDNNFEIIIPDQRMSFDGSTKTASFKSAFFTSGFDIGKTITLVKIKPIEETIPMYEEMERLNNGHKLQ